MYRDRVLTMVSKELCMLHPPVRGYAAHLVSHGLGAACPNCNRPTTLFAVQLDREGVKGKACMCAGCETLTFAMEA